MRKWHRILAAAAALTIIVSAGPLHVSAKGGYLDQCVDDNRQHILLLRQREPNSYCGLITPNPANRRTLVHAAEQITQGCRTDAEKTRAIYQWVTKHLYYDQDSIDTGKLPPADPYTVYMERVAVCEGFATLFAELMNAVGIPCVTFHGSSIGDPLGITLDSISSWSRPEYDDVDHAWNAAYVDGQWRYYDTTWDCGNRKQGGKMIPRAAEMNYYAIDPERIAANHRTAYRINEEASFRLKNRQWLLCNADGSLHTGIWYDNYRSDLYYMENGVPLTGRTVLDYQLIDFEEDGRYIRTMYEYNGWEKYRGDWYYIRNGICCYGWGHFGGYWYYLDPDTSVMEIGWRKIDGNWYYFDRNGAMRTGWQKIGGQWYWFHSWGGMATGWKQLGDTWYYLNGSGEMVTGWRRIHDKWYYFYENGAMAANTVIDGYALDANGTY